MDDRNNPPPGGHHATPVTRLVLERKDGEAFRLLLPDGQEVDIEQLRAGRGKAKLGIRAPRSVRVVRHELLSRDRPRPEKPAA